jgi:hypothetical protein
VEGERKKKPQANGKGGANLILLNASWVVIPSRLQPGEDARGICI